MTSGEYVNLFGEPLAIEKPKRGKHYVEPRGHAGRPGSGPDGESCRTCEFYVRKKSGSGRTFPKCALSAGLNKASRASDIRVRDPACQFWERRDGGVRTQSLWGRGRADKGGASS